MVVVSKSMDIRWIRSMVLVNLSMDIRWIRSMVLVNLSMDLAGCYPCFQGDIHGPDPWILKKSAGY